MILVEAVRISMVGFQLDTDSSTCVHRSFQASVLKLRRTGCRIQPGYGR